MMHVMERHNKLEPEKYSGENVNSDRLLICANAGNPTIRECVKALAGDLDRLFASAMGTRGHSSSSVEIHLMERTLGDVPGTVSNTFNVVRVREDNTGNSDDENCRR